jgi:hypothetical protein
MHVRFHNRSKNRKVQTVLLYRARISVGNPWITAPLQMGHTGATSRLMGELRKYKRVMKKVGEMKEIKK